MRFILEKKCQLTFGIYFKTVFKMYPYSNLKCSVIRSLIFIECSLYLTKNVHRTFEFASNRFQDKPLLKCRKFTYSFSYIY